MSLSLTPAVHEENARTLGPLLMSAGWVGFTGTRAPNAQTLLAIRSAVSRLHPEAMTLVGRAPGDQGSSDEAVWTALQARRPHCKDSGFPYAVFDAHSRAAGHLIERSTQLARVVATPPAPSTQHGLLVAFPQRDLPAVKRGGYWLAAPIPQWVSLQPVSGTWSTIILAAGKGANVLLWLDQPRPPAGGWGWTAAAPGWWYLKQGELMPPQEAIASPSGEDTPR